MAKGSRRNIYYPNSEIDIMGKGGEMDKLAFMWTKLTGFHHNFSTVVREFVRFGREHLEEISKGVR